MQRSVEKKGSGCLRWVATGCGVMILLLLLGAGLVFLNLDRIRDTELFQKISSTVEAGKETVQEMVSLRKELQEIYPAEEISFQINLGDPRGGRLGVVLRNPAFLEEEDDREAKAREIARFVRNRYSRIEDIAVIQVVFASEAGMGALVTREESYSFETAELGEGPEGEASEAP